MALSDDIADALTEAFEQQKQAGEFDDQLNEFMANEVVPAWQSNSPEDSGDYKDSIEITQPANAGKGEVSATVDYANIVEYGSEDTPEYAPRARTIERLRGEGQ